MKHDNSSSSPARRAVGVHGTSRRLRASAPVIGAFSALLLCAAVAPHAGAQTLFYDADGATTTATGGTGPWDTTTVNWRNGSATGTLQAYGPNANPSTVVADFAGTAGTVTIATGTTIDVNTLTVGTTGYAFASNDASSILNFSGTTPTINGTGLTAIATNITGTGGFTIASGSFNVFSGNLSGLTGTINVNARATLQGVAYGTGTAGTVLSGSQNQTWNITNTLTTNNHGTAATIQLGAITGNGLIRSGNDGTGAVPTGDDVFQVGALGTTTTFSGNIQDQSTGNITGLTKVGAGTLILSGTGNSFTGGTQISAGVLNLTGSMTGGATTGTAVSSNGSGIATSATGVFTESTTGIVSGTGKTFAQGSSGISTLAGANTYTGATTVTAGTLLVNNTAVSATSSGTGTGTVAVGSSNGLLTAALAGTGSILGATTVNPGSTISGGTVGTVGTLTLQAGLTLTGTAGQPATYAVDISGTTADELVISGVLALTNAQVTFAGTPTAGTTYILANEGSNTGTFSGTAPAGFAFAFVAGGNGTEFELVPVPEPSSWATFAAVGLVCLARRRQIAGWLASARS